MDRLDRPGARVVAAAQARLRNLAYESLFQAILSGGDTSDSGYHPTYGLWIALDADIRIATEDTSFWLPEPQWGIATIPAAWFPKIMPWAIASELLLMAGRVDARRAYEVGMINRIVPANRLMEEAERIARRFCELSPAAVQGMKESMVKASSLDYRALDQITEHVQTRVMNSEDRREGARAFREKRQGAWTGS